MKKLFILILTLMLAATASAQLISVDNFTHVKKPLLNAKSVKTDKKQAIIDFSTNQKGFSFFANGKIPVQAEEGDGIVSLSVPDKTTYILIKHETYGQCYFKVPIKKGLRKKKHYAAELVVSGSEQYKLQKQWVILHVNPKDAVVYIDSAFNTLNNGTIELYLAPGKHPYSIEAPFYETYSDTLNLSDSTKIEKYIELSPFYSYISVNSGINNSTIIAAGEIIGKTQATSQRLAPGKYRVVVAKDTVCYFDDSISVGKSEKAVIENKNMEWTAKKCRQDVYKFLNSNAVINQTADTVGLVKVNLKVSDDSTEIWLNREILCKGSWEGMLNKGFYAVSSKKDGVESKTVYFWANENISIDLTQSLTALGALNVHGNVTDAQVYINDVLYGNTPCIIQNLPAADKYTVKVSKDGYKEVTQTIKLKANDLTDLEIKMKKKK